MRSLCLVLCLVFVGIVSAENKTYYNRNYQRVGSSTRNGKVTTFYDSNYRQVGRATGSNTGGSKYTTKSVYRPK